MVSAYKLFATNKKTKDEIKVVGITPSELVDAKLTLSEIDITTMDTDDEKHLREVLGCRLPQGNYTFAIIHPTKSNIILQIAYSNTPFLRELAYKNIEGISDDKNLLFNDPTYIGFYKWFLKKMKDRKFIEFIKTSNYANKQIKDFIELLIYTELPDKSIIPSAMTNYATMRGIIMAYQAYNEKKIVESASITASQTKEKKSDSIRPKFGISKETGEIVIIDPGSFDEDALRKHFNIPFIKDPLQVEVPNPVIDKYYEEITSANRALSEIRKQTIPWIAHNSNESISQISYKDDIDNKRARR